MFRLIRLSFLVVAVGFFAPTHATAQDKNFRLAAPAALVDSGALKFILPRFSLKTQIRIEIVDDGTEAEAVLGGDGTPVFDGLDESWRLALSVPDHPGATRFKDWLTSETGQRAITGFQIDGAQVLTLPSGEVVEVAEITFDGDADLGKKASRALCGRCHVVSPENRMGTIGSTPSFYALRTLADWDERFGMFYVLNPHPAFTQVTDVTLPFPDDLPPAIVPIEMDLVDLEAIIAYVAKLEPADLGAPVKHQ